MEMEAAYARIKKKTDKVIQFLIDELPGTTLLYSKILPRSWWCEHTRTIARWLDLYVLRNVRQIKNVHIREIWVHSYKKCA